MNTTVEIRSPELKDAFQAYLINALDHLSKLDLRDHRFLSDVLTVKTAAGSRASYLKPQINWPNVVYDQTVGLRELEKCENLLDRLRGNEHAVNHVHTLHHSAEGGKIPDEQVIEVFYQSVIQRLLIDYCAAVGKTAFDENKFAEVYEPLEEWLLTDYHTIQSFSILRAFNGPEEPVELDSGVRIRRASDNDFSLIAQAAGPDTWDIGFGRSLVEVECEVPKAAGIDTTPGTELIKDVLTALRIRKSGDVHCGIIFGRRKRGTLESSQSLLPTPGSAANYELGVGEVDGIRETFQAIKKADFLPSLQSAIRRFNYGFERWRYDDRLIDFVIALETLFTPDSSSGEIGYKLRMRVPAVLFKDSDPKDRETAKTLITAAYVVRGVLVHAPHDTKKINKALQKGGLTSIEQLSGNVGSYLRQSILKFIEEPQLLDANRMDGYILKLPSSSEGS